MCFVVVECRDVADDTEGGTLTLGLDFPATLAAARVGADWGWANLYRDLAPSILRYLRAHAVNRPDDCLEEVFLQAVHELPGFSGREDDFRAWMFAITHRCLQSGQRCQEVLPDGAGEDEALADAMDIDEKDLGSFSGGEPHVCAIIARLTKDQREVLFLRMIAALSVEQTAQVLGKTPGSVRAIQCRGLQAISRQLPVVAVQP